MRQEEGQEFKTSLSFRVRSCIRKPKEDDDDKEGENGEEEEIKREGEGKEKEWWYKVLTGDRFLNQEM